MKKVNFNRFGAAALHLLICVVIAIIVVAIFWGVWYPNGLASVAGAAELLLIVVGVDVVLGPLLTLILFVPGKKGLAIDITMIAMLQIAALAGGAYVMLQTRPIFLVAMPDRLQLIFANDVTNEDLAEASSPEYAFRSWTGPVLVGSKEPEDPALVWELAASVFGGGAEIDRRPKFYVGFDEMAKPLINRARRLSKWRDSTDLDTASEIAAADAIGAADAIAWVERRGMRPEDIAVIPVAGRTGTSAALFDVVSGKLLKVFPFHPGVIVPESGQLLWSMPDYLKPDDGTL